jgi:hypothetical protein
MKKKLYVWAYTHFPNGLNETCLLTEDGNMLMVIKNMNHKETIRLLLTGNKVISGEYEIKPLKQRTVDGSFPRSVAPEDLPEGFWEAWTKYKTTLN